MVMSSFCLVNLQDENRILWSKRKLTYEDFTGMRPVGTSDIVGAEIKGSIEIVDVPVENMIPKPIVHCYFVKNESWIRIDSKNEKTLAHEQLHFDIYEVYARKIRKAFAGMNSRKISDFNEYQKVYSQLVKECIAYNTLYDNQVYFNDVRQNNWIKKIAAELEKLKLYDTSQ